MLISSTAFTNNGPIPINYQGALSPPLAISAVPQGTLSLALIMHDPNAVNGDYTHWIMWNINPNTTLLASDQLPQGAVVGMTSGGTAGYVNPRPPQGSGRHHYIFELYALNASIDMSADTPPDAASLEIRSHAIAVATFTGTVDA